MTATIKELIRRDIAVKVEGVVKVFDRSALSAELREYVVTDKGSARNNISVLMSDVVIVCGMRVGTASEVAPALRANKRAILSRVAGPPRSSSKNLTGSDFVCRDTPAGYISRPHGDCSLISLEITSAIRMYASIMSWICPVRIFAAAP